MRAIVLAVAALCLLAGPAAARGRHVGHREHVRTIHVRRAVHGRRRRFARRRAHPLVRRDGSPAPALQRLLHQASRIPLAHTAMRYLGARHDPTGFRGPWCGDFLGLVARQTGYKAPAGYRLARNWTHAGPHVAPRPGAIMVLEHHVGIVLAVIGHEIELLSGNHGHRVGVGLYPARRAIAFVEPVRG